MACKPARKEQPITKAEAVSYAKNIDVQLKKGNRNVLNDIIDEDLFADEVAKASGEKSNRGLKDGVKEALRRQSISKQILNSIGEAGSYEFVKQYEKDGHQHVIFRLFGEGDEGGLNYHDFDLAKFDNKIRARDVYVYLTGENLSATMGQIVSSLVKESGENSSRLKQQTEKLTEIRSLMRQGKFNEAKLVYDNLPDPFKRQRSFQMINLEITQGMDEETYSKALAEFESLYKDDPSAQLALFDSYFLRKDYDGALKVINEIDKAVEDPMLNYFRALLYTQKKEDDKAVSHLEKLYADMPEFETGNLELLVNYLELKQYDKAAKVVNAYKSNAKFNQERLEQIKLAYPEGFEQVSKLSGSN